MLHLFGVIEFPPAPPLRLLEGCTRVLIPALVEPLSLPRRVGHPCELGYALRERAELLVAHAALSDVHTRADEVQRLAFIVEDGLSLVDSPPYRAIRPNGSEL